MTRHSSNLTLSRHWALLKRLPRRRPGVTALELTVHLQEAGYIVSKRTIERDLQELSGIFSIECNDRSKPFGWHWMNGHSTDLPGVDIADAVSLCIAADILKSMLPVAMLNMLEHKFIQARQTLDNLDEHQLSRWTQKVRYVPASAQLLPPPLQEDVIAVIYEALLSEVVINVNYTAVEQPSRSLRLHPLNLVQRGNVGYLVATAFDFTDVRLYAMHRFTSARATNEPCTKPESYCIDRYINEGGIEFGHRNEITLEATLHPSLAHHLRETPLSNDQQIVDQGDRLHLTATVRDTWQFTSWLLSQGPKITVLEPTKLRDHIFTELERSLAQYRS